MKRNKFTLLIVLLLQIILTNGSEMETIADDGINSFSTNGQTVYHLRTGSVKKDQRAIITVSIDGVVKCFASNGQLEWQAGTNEGFPFDLCVADIDNDGLDEILVASGNGSLYAFDNDGKSLWVFSRVAPLYQVSVAKKQDGSATILTGGIEQVLYAISPQGEVVNQLTTKYCIRHIRTGNILNDGNDYVVLATTSSGRGNLTLMLINPVNLFVIWEKERIDRIIQHSDKRFFSMLITDINNDGYNEILLSGGGSYNGVIHAFDHLGGYLFSKWDDRIPAMPYRMNLLRIVKLANDEFILGHLGNLLIVYELDGTFREVVRGPYSFADSHFDPELKTLFMGSSVSGGDGIYSFRLDQPGWQKQFESIAATGKLATIEGNLKTLSAQINNFNPPAYQPAPSNADLMAKETGSEKFQHLSFRKTITLSQKIVNPDELWCRSIDSRRPYDMTADELVDIVAEYEANKENIIIMAAHGDAFYFPVSTFERLIKAAPNHLLGFIFTEMEERDQKMQDVVENIVLPVAELCKEHEKIIAFWNKNIFWNGTCYLPFWSEVLLNERYSDVFVPGLEETNNRTQELSLAGRIGLWQTGYFDHWACRTVTDNVNFDRMFEWGGQQVISHHLRNLVSAASMGSDVFFCSIDPGLWDYSAALYEQLVPFYKMLDKGIIHIPKRNELLSLSGFALGIKSPPSEVYIKHGTNGHSYWFPITGKTEMVFDHLDTYWGGAPLDTWDYSYYAFNIRRRLPNFLPNTPYGMTAIIPAETRNKELFKKIQITDGEYFYDNEGRQFTAMEYQPQIETALNEAAEKMPLIVKGDVHWSAVRLDSIHLRITLIDPGYLDPGDREVEVVFQNMDAIVAKDILSGEYLSVKQGKMKVEVPMGTLRVIDIMYLVTKNKTSTLKTNPYIYNIREGIIAYVPNSKTARYQLYSVDGKLIDNGTLHGNNVSNHIPVWHKGVVLFRVEWEEGVTTYKAVF